MIVEVGQINWYEYLSKFGLVEETKKNPEIIDLRVVMSKIWQNKKTFQKTPGKGRR